VKHRLESIASILLTAAALTIAATLVRREFFPRSSLPIVEAAGPPSFVEGWEELLSAGVHSSDVASRIKIIEFTDLECPFCGAFHETLRATQQRFGSQVSHVFVHYPLSSHRFAKAAAHAAECADRSATFHRFIDVVFAKQDSLGLKSWTSYASDAGIRDTAAFSACNTDKRRDERVEQGLRLGEKIGVRGTPTVIVNGWRFGSTPTEDQLSRVVADILAGRKPTT
jgi:protein-disulfide isomerase